MEGDIAVSSEPEKGTTFEVFLPVIEHSVDVPENQKGEGVSRGTERILFVDDEEDLVYAGEKMLKRLGYEPAVFQNSLEALEAFRAGPDRFDLIITDQGMPHMTGTELAREALRIRPGIPIICAADSVLIRARPCPPGGRRNRYPGSVDETARQLRDGRHHTENSGQNHS